MLNELKLVSWYLHAIYSGAIIPDTDSADQLYIYHLNVLIEN